MAEQTTDWWREVPCHFKWNLEKDTTKDYATLINNLESKLSDYPPNDTRRGALLLYRSYLPASKFKKSVNRPAEGIELLDSADEFLNNLQDDEERRAHKIVSLANRLWMIQSSTKRVEKEKIPLEELKVLWMDEKNKTKELFAHINAIEAFALTRLGLSKYTKAEKLYRQALRCFPENPKLLYDLGRIVGRIARQKTDSHLEINSEMKEEIELYEKALEFDPSDDSVRCDLALVLIRMNKNDRADEILSLTKDDTSSVIIKKGRIYRQGRMYDKALEVLERGTKFDQSRGELHLQKALVFNSKSCERQISSEQERQLLKEEELKCIELCLEKEPRHFRGRLRKAIVLSNLRHNAEADEAFRRLIRDVLEEGLHDNILEAKAKFAHFLDLRRSRSEAAKTYEEIIDEAVAHCSVENDDGSRCIRMGITKWVTPAKKYLIKYYTRENKHEQVKQLKERLGKFGI